MDTEGAPTACLLLAPLGSVCGRSSSSYGIRSQDLAKEEGVRPPCPFLTLPHLPLHPENASSCFTPSQRSRVPRPLLLQPSLHGAIRSFLYLENIKLKCSRLNNGYPKEQSPLPGTLNVTLFEERVFADVIKHSEIRRLLWVMWVGPNSFTSELKRNKGKAQT